MTTREPLLEPSWASSPAAAEEGRPRGVCVHPTAVVDPRATLEAGVAIGPYCVLGADVVVGRDTVLLAHVALSGPTRVGRRCVLHPFSVVGGPAQMRSDADGGAGSLVVGDDVVVREHVTIHRGTGGRETRVGSRVLLMVGSHIGHDVCVGDDVVIANSVQLAGHAVVEDFVTFGGLAGVAQRVRVGESSFVAAGAMCESDVPPFVIVQGDRARVRALNKIGLARRGVAPDSVRALERAFRDVFVRRGATRLAAAESLEPDGDAFVARFRAALLRARA